MARKSKAQEPAPKATRLMTRIVRSLVSRTAMSSDPFALSPFGGGVVSQVDFAREGGRRGAEVLGLGSGPSSTSIINSTVARRRSRYAVLTNPYAKRAVDVLVSNVVGSGTRMVSLAPNKEFKKQVEKLFSKWCKKADTTGALNYAGLEALSFRSMIEGGDCFLRLRTRRPSDGLPVPLQLQLLESEQVPVIMNETRGVQSIIGGIQYDALGKPVFYHMYRNHPGEFMLANAQFDASTTVPVPADDVIHLHEIRRPNDARGLPFLSQVLIQLSDLDRYLDAELVRKKAAALIGGFIKQPADGGDNNPFSTSADPDELEIEPMEPGTFPVLPPGYEVQFSAPVDVGISFKEFMRQQLLAIAAGLNITFEQLTGDLSNVNDRTLRATMLEFKRMAVQYQRHVLVHQMHERVFQRWFDLAIISGALVIPAGMDEDEARAVKWIADPWNYLNPTQEITAQKDEIRAGFTSRSAIIMARGDDPDTVDDQIAADKERQRELGLTFDTDPDTMSRAGVAQFTDPEKYLAKGTVNFEGDPVGDSLSEEDSAPEEEPVESSPQTGNNEEQGGANEQA